MGGPLQLLLALLVCIGCSLQCCLSAGTPMVTLDQATLQRAASSVEDSLSQHMVACPDRVGALIKLAHVYSKLSTLTQTLNKHMQTTEGTFDREMKECLHMIRSFDVDFLLETKFKSLVPAMKSMVRRIDEWRRSCAHLNVDEMVSGIVQLCADFPTCSTLPSPADLSNIYQMHRETERRLNSKISIGRMRAEDAKALTQFREELAMTLDGCRFIESSPTVMPVEILTWLVEVCPTRKMQPDSVTPIEVQGNIDDLIKRLSFPKPTADPCYSQKMTVYRIVIMNTMLAYDINAVGHIVKRALEISSPLVEGDRNRIVRLIQNTVGSDIYTEIGRILATPKVRALTMAQSQVATIRHLVDPPTSSRSPTELTRAHLDLEQLGWLVETFLEVLEKDKSICEVDPGYLSGSINRIIDSVERILHPNAIRELIWSKLKPVNMRNEVIGKVAEICYNFVADLYSRNSALMVTITSGMEANTAGPIREMITFMQKPLVCKVLSLKRRLPLLGFEPHTPLMMIPVEQLRELVLNITEELMPTDPYCGKKLAVVLAAGFSRSYMTRRVLAMEEFINLLLARQFVPTLTPTETRLVSRAMTNLILTRFKGIYTNREINSVERMAQEIVRMPEETFRQPALKALSTIMEHYRRIVATATLTPCDTTTIEMMWTKTITAMLEILRRPVPISQIEQELVPLITNSSNLRAMMTFAKDTLPLMMNDLMEMVDLLRTTMERGGPSEMHYLLTDYVMELLMEAAPMPMRRSTTMGLRNMKIKGDPLSVITYPEPTAVMRNFAVRLGEILYHHGIQMEPAQITKIIQNVAQEMKEWKSGIVHDSVKYPRAFDPGFKVKMDLSPEMKPIMNILGSLRLHDVRPRLRYDVIGYTLEKLEVVAMTDPTCIKAAHFKLLRGFLKVELERRLFAPTPNSVMFSAIYHALQWEVPHLTDAQLLSVIQNFGSEVKERYVRAMTGLDLFKDVEPVEHLVAELLETTTMTDVRMMTMKDVIITPLEKILKFVTETRQCTVDERRFVKDTEEFYRRFTTPMNPTEISKMLESVLPDAVMCRNISTRIATIVWPQLCHQVAGKIVFCKNAFLGECPTYRKALTGNLVNMLELRGPFAPVDFVNNPMYNIFATKVQRALLFELTTKRPILHPAMAASIIGETYARTLEIVFRHVKGGLFPLLHELVY